MKKCQPLSVKTVIVPKGQNSYGKDIVRFTADYVASDLFDMCIGCYPPCQSNLEGVVVISDDHSTFYPNERESCTLRDAHHDIDLRKATSGVCQHGDPVLKTKSLSGKLGTPLPEPPAERRYWEV